MESYTNISTLLAGKSISVPNYQRAYSWDTDSSNKSPKQVNTFLSDLQDYVNSHSSTPYYFGHFLFEEKGENKYAIIDGQQRLTTTVIFLSALYKQLKQIRNIEKVDEFDDDLYILYCNTIKQRSQYRFSTVGYDNQMFRDYVIDQTIHNRNEIDTVSKERIVNAFDFFCNELTDKTEEELLQLLEAMTKASCTTHVVKDESEAVQMFIFQNNRGKKPTKLEIIKAQFMYDIHLHAPVEDKQNLLSEITERFEHIYKSISKIEGNIDEDNVLNYTIKVYRNSLDDINSTDFVNKELDKADSCISFIREFTQLLSSCFSQISNFLDETKKNITYHALLVAADRSIMFPFVIKALLKGMPQKELEELARALEQIFLRHRIIGTRANLLWRLHECYKNMDNSAKTVVNHIQWMKSRKDWWGYWNNDELLRTLNMGMNHNTAKILLWKYENHLIQCGKAGYKVLRYDDIEQPHLEHIAPQTENKEPNNGYCSYDEDFYNRYLECLGNYLLLSGSHNMSLSNERFQKKRESYTYLQQQREVLGMTEKDPIWDKDKIQQRHSKIVDYLMQIL
ncbi:hypothetical protein AXF23_00570 [Prevotella sp. oral taxon 313]|uniref:DUF262 domain-containing protein n=1 Tax=Prevotella sp. oral taxon 313 TaxID=652722 RepID=UPI000D1E71FA|nr:DUF262 domain-containing protein [Prevotella sp. oral taxon 313]PTL29777.1 hypothetical protein AXF23_00570 [Prevotella sp. oral taxon 313]